MKPIDFCGFRFGKIHTSDLHLEVVSTSDRYEPRILPAPTDTTLDIPGSDGQYYFGSVYKNREITCNLAFDNVSEQIYRKIRQLFATDKLQDLVFDEEPYKTWRAKIKSKPEFKSLCFTDKESGERVYKGTGKLVFICYFPYAFGFDKYVVRAADYYTLNPPQCIIQEAYSDNTFVKSKKDSIDVRHLPEDINYHYNTNPSDYEGGTTEAHVNAPKFRDKTHRNRLGRSWEPNDKTPWKTGFPTYDQVVAGELFFDTPDGEKSLIDVRSYWDNVPEWESTAKLLYTPTLDYDQELMYLPQYSKTDFINMDLGFNSSRAMIGSRMLVYNPGDLPVEWEIRFDENKRSFWSCRGGTKFRIRRFNVERLNIENAVDWCGLTTYEAADNEPYKYGTKYFKRRKVNMHEIIEALENGDIDFDSLPPIRKPGSHAEINSFYTKEELIAALRMGVMPADKQWGDKNYVYPDKPFNELTPAELDNYVAPGIQSDKIAFNLHLDDEAWQQLIPALTLAGLGKAHPHHCYYVEPIPRQKLGHYIKLFYWQTIQWRGDRLPTGEWIADLRYGELAKDVLVKVTNEDGKEEIRVKDINNPLVNFIKMFADISTEGVVTNAPDRGNVYREIYKDLNFERGIELANRYEELFAGCITEEEEYELYWKTLKMLLKEFTPILKKTYDDWWFSLDYSERPKYYRPTEEEMIDQFIDSYINHPSEFINSDMRDLDYANDVFNGYKMPEWMTNDYIEIDQMALSGVETARQFLEAVGEGTDKVFTGSRRQYTDKDKQYLIEAGIYSKLINTLDNTIGVGGYINDLLDDYYYLNTDNRMLYTTANPYGMEFVYKPNKVIMNDAITQGKWFKLPPGWSLICVEPVVDESLWGGKRWEDARPYDWGYSGDLNRNKREVQQLYDYVYDLAREEFFAVYPKESIVKNIIPEENLEGYEDSHDDINGTEDPVDELLKFKVWYQSQLQFHENSETYNYFAKSLFKKYKNDGEYAFLKIINSIWSSIAPYYTWTVNRGVWTDPDKTGGHGPDLDDFDITGRPLRCINNDISDWWWYACNYVWANFPPLYWAVADMLNRLQIKYTPLYY